MLYAMLLSALLLLPADKGAGGPTSVKATAQIEHTGHGVIVDVVFPGENYDDVFIIDTGSTITMMDSYNLLILAMHGKAHILGADQIAGIDGIPQMYPIYMLDEIQIGNCTIKSNPGHPRLLVAGGSVNLIGRTLLNDLGDYTISADTLSFDCPR